MDVHELFRQAHEKLEGNDFSGACLLFRQAGMLSEPSERQLANMAIAEDEDRLQYRRELCKRYPNSLVCLFSTIQTLHTVGRFKIAIQLASAFLRRGELNAKETILVRLQRLKSAISAHDHEIIVEDFCELWTAGTDNEAARRCRKPLIIAIASSANPELAETIDHLAKIPLLDTTVVAFLRGKADELHALVEVQKNW